ALTSCCTGWWKQWTSGLKTGLLCKKRARKNMPGKVFLVGAGPGAVDLLTLRAASLLRAAEIVLHDDLVPAEILEVCPASAEIINVGKRCGRNGRSQEQINTLMVWHARETQAQTIV